MRSAFFSPTSITGLENTESKRSHIFCAHKCLAAGHNECESFVAQEGHWKCNILSNYGNNADEWRWMKVKLTILS